MCLAKDYKYPKISKKKITVYKWLYWGDECMETPYEHKKVKIGKTVHSKIHPLFGIFREYIKAEGVHSYYDKSLATLYAHSTAIARGKATCVVKCVIPRGTFYYESFNEIASGRLKYKAVVDFFPATPPPPEKVKVPDKKKKKRKKKKKAYR